MSYLLDTNVISELRLETPDQGVWSWASNVNEMHVFLSVITLAGLRSGAERLPSGKRRAALETWLEHDVRDRFRGRILGIDEDVADRCGKLLGTHHLEIGIRRIMDFWLAAIALHHGLTIVSRNIKDFQGLGVGLLNPWTEQPA